MDNKVIKTRDKTKKRNMIINGATKAFMEYGYKNSSMDVIAEVAGVSKKTVYNHFKSKENVIITIISEYLEGKTPFKDIQYDQTKSIKEQLLSFINAELYLVNSPERLALARVLTQTFIEDIHLAMRIVAGFEPNHLKFNLWLKEASYDNKLIVENYERASSVFYGLIEGMITYPALFQQELNIERTNISINEIISIFLCKYEK